MTVAIAASTIAQLAFEALELPPPSSFGDDSDQVNSAALHYDTALTMCLEAQDWGFASRLADLSAVADAAITDSRLPYGFRLPADCAMLREVMADGAAWRRDIDMLRADEAGPLRIRYTCSIADESALPATFRAAVALQLALLMAPRWLEVQGKIDRIDMRLRDAMALAARADARTASPVSYRDGPDTIDWATEAMR